MTKIVIKIEDCDPDVKNPHASRKDKDEFEWKNQNAFEVTVAFDKLPAPIFEGYGVDVSLPIRARGSVSVRLLETAPPGTYDYDVTSVHCHSDEINPDTIIIDP